MINLDNFRMILTDFYDIFQKKQTFLEIILNLTFILILFMFAAIFYWDSINRSVINSSRCKILINNDDAFYGIDAYDDTGKTKLYNIIYDNTKNHNVKVACACPTGNTDNQFNRLKYYDYQSQQLNDITLKCKCDKNYATTTDYNPANDKNRYMGDKFLTDYYNQEQITGILNFPS